MPQSVKYKHPLSHYAQEYEVSLSTIKRYARKGYALDDPEMLSRQIVRQKNRPAGVYRGKFRPQVETSRQRHMEVPSNLFAVLVRGQWMRREAKLVCRALRGITAHYAHPKIRANMAQDVEFLIHALDKELAWGIHYMFRAAAGESLESIREHERNQRWENEEDAE